jgi:DNA polymerase eta
LVKGEAAKARSSSARESSRTATGPERSEKRRRLEGTTGIQKFFGKPDSTGEHDDDFGAHGLLGNSPSAEAGSADRDEFEMAASPYINEATKFQQENNLLSSGTSALHQQQITDYICTRCNRAIEPGNVDSHQDWHFAKDLQDGEKGQLSHQLQATTTSKTNKKSGTNTNKKKSAREKPEKGQSKLAFG